MNRIICLHLSTLYQHGFMRHSGRRKVLACMKTIKYWCFLNIEYLFMPLEQWFRNMSHALGFKCWDHTWIASLFLYYPPPKHCVLNFYLRPSLKISHAEMVSLIIYYYYVHCISESINFNLDIIRENTT